jgi:hypothetical protein
VRESGGRSSLEVRYTPTSCMDLAGPVRKQTSDLCRPRLVWRTECHVMRGYSQPGALLPRRTERLLSLARLREALVRKVSASLTCRYWAVRASRNPQKAAARRGMDAGHVGGITSSTSWTLLQITCPRRSLKAPSATWLTPESGLEITAARRVIIKYPSRPWPHSTSLLRTGGQSDGLYVYASPRWG